MYIETYLETNVMAVILEVDWSLILYPVESSTTYAATTVT